MGVQRGVGAERSGRPGSARRALRRVLLTGIAALYVLSIPWYREGGGPSELWWGLPDWVAVALGCYAVAALLNAVAWLLTEVPDAAPGEGPES
ncbi:MAG: hypothetical protein ABFS46_20500 [Myxococcota bacterium]